MKSNLLKFICLFMFLGMINSQMEQQLAIKVKNPENNKISINQTLDVVLSVNIFGEWHINSNKPNDEFLIPTELTLKPEGFKIKNIKYPKAKNIKFDFSDKPVSVFEGTFDVVVTVEATEKLIKDKNLKTGKHKANFTFSYQACNNSTCMPPSDIELPFEFDVNLELVNVNENSDTNTTIINNEEPKETENTTQKEIEKKDDVESSLAGGSLLLNILFVFLGGLALNLTPCVYPLIPITIGYFGGQSEGKTSKLFMLGVFYVLGMAITYSVVGVVTALSGAVFGALLQNPIVVVIIGLIFVALALSMFGLYEFKMPDSWVMKAGGAKTGVMGAFFMGLTMGIVAAPCIGPFVLSLVTFVAAKADPFYGFIMFFSLAVGLGTPYIVLAVFSGKLKSLPRAGFWMNAVKKIFGFLMLGMAIYFVNPILPKEINVYTLPIFAIITALYLLLFDKSSDKQEGFRIFKIVFSLLIYTYAIFSLSSLYLSSNSTGDKIQWEKYDDEKISLSFENNKKVIVDFYADWCIPCKEFDAITFVNSEVIELSKGFDNYKVDMTKNTDENDELRKKYKVVGMPTIIIFNSEGEEVERLTGFIGPEEYIKILKSIN